MRAVGLKTLKNRLSEYVRLVANGETVLVTDRDRVVAELTPPRAGEVLHCKADIRKLREELGFVPDPDIRRGLVEYFQWFAKDRSAAAQ